MDELREERVPSEVKESGLEPEDIREGTAEEQPEMILSVDSFDSGKRSHVMPCRVGWEVARAKLMLGRRELQVLTAGVLEATDVGVI